MAEANGFGSRGSMGGSALQPAGQMYQGNNANGQTFGQNLGTVGLQGTGVNPATNTQTGGYQYGIGDSGAIQNSVANPTTNTAYIDPASMPVQSVGAGQQYVGQMQDAYYDQARARLDPQWQDTQQDLEAQLANMGLSRGSEAWNREMQNLNFGKNDAYEQAMRQAILTSGAEAQRMQGMEIAGGQFANTAAQQGYQNQIASQQAQNAATGQQFNQGLQQGQFANQAQNQLYTQNMGQAGLNNSAISAQQAAAQGWGQQATQRYGADQGLKGAEATAGGMVGAANATAGASMANAQLASQLQARQIANAEQQQAWSNARQSTFDTPTLQNLYMNGMYTNQAPTMPAIPQASYPGQTSQSDYAGLIAGGTNQQYGGYGQIAGSLGGVVNSYLPQPQVNTGGGYFGGIQIP